MSKTTRADGRRAMGWATLVGGVLLVAFWVLYFTGALEIAHDPMIAAFESAFPIADAVFCVVLFAASRSLFTGRSSGPFLLAWAGAVSVYLGLLDVTFYGGQGAYSAVTATVAFELALNLFCVGGGSVALLAAWRLSNGRDAFAIRRRTWAVGKVALIVGASNRVGAATAMRLAKAGVRLGLADIDENAVARLQDELSTRGYRSVAFRVDLAEPDSVDDLVDGALMAFGRVDALINCTGVLHPHASRALLPHFRRKQTGHLIHVAPATGRPPAAGRVARAIVRVLSRPKLEVLVIAQTRWLARFGALRLVALRAGLVVELPAAWTPVTEGA